MVLLLVFAFGCSVGFLGERSVIHPLFGKTIETQESENHNSWEDHGLVRLSASAPVQGPLYRMAGGTHRECVGTRWAGVSWLTWWTHFRMIDFDELIDSTSWRIR